MTVGSQVKGCYSSIKNAEATLQLLANKTIDEQSRQIYNIAEHILAEVKTDLHDQVIFIVNEEQQYK